MPGNLMFADLSFPTIGEGESTKVSLQKVQNYLFMLLENLRYVLQNLEPGNFNEVEMEGYFKKLTADLVVADVVISNTIITNELYADYGSIADLTVDKLRTDYKKAANYLAGNKSPIDYISIHDEEISFLTATTTGAATEQLTVNGRAFWWTDGTKTQMTSEKNTGIPVTVYVYSELVKRAIRFDDNSGTKIPMDVFGAGSGVGDNGKAFLYKGTDGLYLDYHSLDTGALRRIMLGDAGVTITPYSLDRLDFYANGFRAVYAGENLAYTWTKDGNGRIISLTSAENVTIPVAWNGGNL